MKYQQASSNKGGSKYRRGSISSNGVIETEEVTA